MAYVYKDMWGKDQVGGVQDDINKAVKDRDFTRGVGQIQDDLQKKMERNLVVGAAGTAAMVAGTGFFLFRWIRHLKNDLYYRYKWELRLHYVAASFLWCYVLGTAIDKAPLFIYERTGKVVQWLVDAPQNTLLVIGVIVVGALLGVIWTRVYKNLRYDVKVRRLDHGKCPMGVRESISDSVSLIGAGFALARDIIMFPIHWFQKKREPQFPDAVFLTANQLQSGTTLTIAGHKVRIPAGTVDGQKMRVDGKIVTIHSM